MTTTVVLKCGPRRTLLLLWDNAQLVLPSMGDSAFKEKPAETLNRFIREWFSLGNQTFQSAEQYVLDDLERPARAVVGLLKRELQSLQMGHARIAWVGRESIQKGMHFSEETRQILLYLDKRGLLFPMKEAELS